MNTSFSYLKLCGLGPLLLAVLFAGSAPARAASGNITFSPGGSPSFIEAGFLVGSFWVQTGNNFGGHLHVSGGVENHHWQGNNARQGLFITALDGSSFNLCSIDVAPFGFQSINRDLEVGTAFPSLNPGNAVPGYAQFPGAGTIAITGFDNLTGVYITSQSGQQWDNVLFCVRDDDGDGVNNDADLCPDTGTPPEDGVPLMGELNPNHWALTNDDFVFDTVIKGKGKGPNRSYTIEDTAGCSCEQIIAELGLGDGHTQHGCSISAMDDWIEFFVNP